MSAIKVDGKRAYTLAREGEEVVLPERPVTVSAFEVLETRRGEWIDLDVRVECTSGTYIRALARDLGDALGVGGHLTALRRTRIGPFAVDAAAAIDEHLVDCLKSPAAVARELFAAVDLDARQSVDLAHGKRIPLVDPGSSPVAAIGPGDRLIGLVEVIDGQAHILANFPPDQVPQ